MITIIGELQHHTRLRNTDMRYLIFLVVHASAEFHITAASSSTGLENFTTAK